MTMSNRKRFVAAICALGLTAAGVAGCSNSAKETASNAEATVKSAGDAAVNGSKEAAGKAKDAADKAGDAAKEAGKAADDAAKDAGKTAGDAAKDAVDAAKDAGKDAKDAAKDAGKDAAEAAKDVAADAKSAADDAVKSAESVGKDAAKDAKDAAKDLEVGDMVKVTDAAGASVSIPAAINTKATELGESTVGKLVNVKNAGEKWVASYSNGWHIAYDKDHGAQPVKGKIGQVWFDNGNITNPVGMPTAPEKTKQDGNWVQSFTKGQIWANTDGTSGTETK